MNTLGEYLRTKRLEVSGIYPNRKLFAKEIDISETYISLIENNKYLPSTEILKKYISVANADIEIITSFYIAEIKKQLLN